MDVIYTKEPMEITEELVAAAYKAHQVNLADIESNNGEEDLQGMLREERKNLEIIKQL